MRFSEYLRATVTLLLASAVALTIVSMLAILREGDVAPLVISVVWLVIAPVLGLWFGRAEGVMSSIATHLSRSRPEPAFPKIEPAAVLLGRHWPLILVALATFLAGAWFPTVPAIAAGYALIWAVAWRRQASAVEAIEDRDSVHFWIVRTSVLAPIKIVRVPRI